MGAQPKLPVGYRVTGVRIVMNCGLLYYVLFSFFGHEGVRSCEMRGLNRRMGHRE